MKKLLSVFLAVLLVFLLCAPAFAAAGETSVPTVYIVGGAAWLQNAEGEKVLPVDLPEGYLSTAISDCLPDIIKAMLLRTDEARAAYSAKLLSWAAPMYEKAVMDQNGDPIGEYTPLTDYSMEPFVIPDVADNRISNGVYDIRAYDFYYDWRLDPYVNAGLLSDYIEAILRGTGAEKVNLLGRCEGATVVMAYLAKYGHDKVNKICFNTSAAEGYLLTTAIFSGEMQFSSETLNAYLNNNPNFSLDSLDLSSVPMGEELLLMLAAMLDAGAAAPELDIPARLLDSLYTDLVRDALPDVLLASYGSFPAMWAMVDADHFDAAVAYVFAGREEEYAGLIARIRDYHENVALKTEEILLECEQDGVEIGSITKYGYPAMPLCAEAEALSDGQAFVRLVSFGATASTHSGTLDQKYINRRISEGKGRYISADGKIDASTCLFPDTAWFVGNLEHGHFPWMIDELAQRFFTAANYTVDSDPAYPQFMLFDDAAYAFVPLTKENASRSTVGTQTETPSFSDSMGSFAEAFGRILIRLITFLQTFIQGIVAHSKGTA